MGHPSGAWISDLKLFDHASTFLRRHWKQVPVAHGLTGNFPVVRDQRQIIGSGHIVGSEVFDDIPQSSLVLRGRQWLPTRIRTEAFNRQGRALTTTDFWVSPDGDHDEYEVTLDLSDDALITDPASQIRLMMRRPAPVTWRLSVFDGRGRVLDQSENTYWYSA